MCEYMGLKLMAQHELKLVAQSISQMQLITCYFPQIFHVS